MTDNTRLHPTSGEPDAVLNETSDIALSIRPLESHEDFDACVALQRELWGSEYDLAAPASLLHVAPHIGALVMGAFGADGELLGFVFGLTGVKNQEIVHWSHVLGVRKTARNLGVGRMLKDSQRAELARRGIRSICWTFDPLIAKNAHFNLNRLGARVIDYVVNMYGPSDSPLHHGLATDRLVVSWPTDPAATGPGMAATSRTRDGLILTDTTPSPDVHGGAIGWSAPIVWIEVPTDFDQLLMRSPSLAAGWQSAIRRHFKWALRNGYAVTGLYRDPVSAQSFYTLVIAATIAETLRS